MEALAKRCFAQEGAANFMMKSTYKVMATLSMMLCVFAGCETREFRDISPESAQKDPPKMTLILGGIEYGYSQAAAAEFERENPDIVIRMEFGLQTVDDGSIQALLKSGSGPDILVVNSGPGRIESLVRDRLILPINDIYQRLDLDSRYLPSVIEQLKVQNKQGLVYEIVEGTDVFQMYYHKKIFHELGLNTSPQTWEEFLDVCRMIQKAGIQPIAAGFKGGTGAGWLGGLLMESAAGSRKMAEVLYGEGSFYDDSFIQGYALLKQLIDLGYIDREEALALNEKEAGAAFYNAQYGMFATAHSVLLRAKAADGTLDTSEYGSFVLPSLEQGRPSLPTGGIAHSWVVNASIDKSKLPAIEKWIDFISGQDYLRVKMRNGANLIPALVRTPSDIFIDPLFKDAMKKAQHGTGYNPSVYLPGTSKRIWFESLQAVTNASLTPAEAAEQLDRSIKQWKSGG